MTRNRWLVLACFTLTCSAAAGALNRAIIVAADGTFVGTCEGTASPNSISNDYGLYGSEYAMNSPFNKYSMQAPYILAYSADLYALFTAAAYRPTPAIVTALQNSATSRVSVNPYLPRAIDPNVLRVACRNP